MLIERDIETKIKDKLVDVINDEFVEVISSWQPSDSDSIKGENNKESHSIVSIFISPRTHDAFSLPTVNMNGMIALDCRVEQCPTMKEVSEIYEKISDLMDDWHYDATKFSEEISTDDFYATEIMLTGGDKVVFDRNQDVWTVSIGFTIRGNVNH